MKGAPEYIVIFTSKEVITGRNNKNRSVRKDENHIRDEWFKTRKKETHQKP